MYRAILLTFLLAIPTFQVVPILPIVDERPNPVDLTNGISVNEVAIEGEVDVSAKRAAEQFEKLHNLMKDGIGERTHLSHYILNVNPQTDNVNNTMLEEWRIGHGLDGQRNYKLILTTTDAYNEETPIHVQEIDFHCKFMEVVEHMLCIPDKCDLEPFETTPTPGVICAFNYRNSQKLLTTFYESSHSIDKEDLGDGLYESTIDCMKKKIERITLRGNIECYYEGFEPDNIVSREEMEKVLIEEGWKRLESGEFERETVVEEKEASGVVDTNEMTLNESP